MRSTAIRLLVWLTVIAVTGLGAPPPVAASTVPETEAGGGEARGVELLPTPMEAPESYSPAARGFAVWERGSRGYFLVNTEEFIHRWPRLSSMDLRTGEETGHVDLVPAAYDGGEAALDLQGLAFHAVDEEGGRLFLASQIQPVVTSAEGRNEMLKGGLCAYLGGDIRMRGCFGGVHVFDADTLETQNFLRYRPVNVETVSVAPQLLAMEYAPARGPDDGDKVLAVVSEYVHHVLITAPGLPNAINARAGSATAVYLVQFDVSSGVQEWSVRLDACRGGREQRDDNENLAYRNLPHPAGVMRRPVLEDPAIFVACHANFSTQQAAVVKVPLDSKGNAAGLPVTVGDPMSAASEAIEGQEPSAPAGQAEGQSAVFGPDKVMQMLVDPASERIVMQVIDGSPLAEVWWVFDGKVNQFVGTIGIGAPTRLGGSLATLERSKGRLYVLTPSFTLAGSTSRGGLFVADVRRTPVPQALHFDEFREIAPPPQGVMRNFLVASGGEQGPTRIYVPEELGAPERYRVLLDHMPAAQVVLGEAEPYAGRTLDLEEQEGVTASVADGAARGYGARVVFVGGAEAASRVGPVDAIGVVEECSDRNWPVLGRPGACHGTPHHLSSPCTAGNRDITLAFVGPEGPSVVDASGTRGTADPVAIDSATRADGEAALSRCSGLDWDEIWGTALFGRAPTPEPNAPWILNTRPASCVTAAEATGDEVGDPHTGRFAAAVHCEDQEASGYSYARGQTVAGVDVAEAISTFRIYRDPGRGIVSRVESVVRGVSIPGVLRIDTVRGVAESWANGRRSAVGEPESGEAYDPNCDFERTAGTCFRKHVVGVWTPGYQCGPCGDEATFADRMSRALGANGSIRFRTPDPVLARGADNGFTAAITKPEHERFADLVLNNDLLQTVVPTLEIIRYAPPNRPLTRGGPRGRQIIQLAGVEVSSSYGISCLLVFDEESNTCAAPAEAPGSIVVSLQDGAGEPLAGGGFEVRQDVDVDGVLGLVDTLVADGACVTADDGIGTCRFENLQPGAYLVSQVAAPPGYAKSDEPWVSEVASGEQRTVVFTNVSNVSTIELSAEDADGNALSGAVFAAYPDPDADGKVAPEAEPAATCTTDESGSCTMSVPAGSYVLVQTGAPGGLEGIEPVPFTFASGGQVAAVTVTNYPPESVDAPPPAPGPVYTPPVDMAPPVESIDDYTPPADQPEIAPDDKGIVDQVGGTVVQVIRAPGDALRLLSRDPKQAAAWMAALALFCLAVMAVRRRQQAMALIR